MTIHIVYPYGPRKAAPWSIGNHLAAHFRAQGEHVVQVDWDGPETLTPTGPEDVLLGHPHPQAGPFLRSIHAPWNRIVALAPWTQTERNTDFVESWRHDVDHYCAICGPYWAHRLPTDWWNALGNVTPLDMAIDPADYPPITEHRWNPPGQRRAVYIGCTLPGKGMELLEALIALVPELQWLHIGPGTVRGAENLGYLPIEGEEARKVLASVDFLIAPGDGDANPTVVLEAACLGLIPIVAPGAGWDCFCRLPPEPDQAVELLRSLASVEDTEALGFLQRCSRTFAKTYTWERFCMAVEWAVTDQVDRYRDWLSAQASQKP